MPVIPEPMIHMSVSVINSPVLPSCTSGLASREESIQKEHIKFEDGKQSGTWPSLRCRGDRWADSSISIGQLYLHRWVLETVVEDTRNETIISLFHTFTYHINYYLLSSHSYHLLLYLFHNSHTWVVYAPCFLSYPILQNILSHSSEFHTSPEPSLETYISSVLFPIIPHFQSCIFSLKYQSLDWLLSCSFQILKVSLALGSLPLAISFSPLIASLPLHPNLLVYCFSSNFTPLNNHPDIKLGV